MGRILRVGLMVLLVAAAGVGIASGEVKPIRIDGIDWEYEQIDATTCRIQIPKGNRSSISGSVTIPSKVEDGSLSLTVVEIAKEAFYMCSKLTAVKFPSGLTTIGGYAFFDCSKLTGVKFPSGLTTIGEEAFYGCGLTEVTIYSSVREIGDKAFSDCSGLKEFKVDAENASYSQDGGVLFTKDRDTLVSYPGGRKGAYEIPGSVTGIVAGAFSGCEGLTAVTIPGSVKTIEEWTFDGCSELTGVEFPSGLTTIGEYAFFECNKLTGVKFPSGLTTIGSSAFFNCHGLTEVKFPNGLTTIGDNAFFNCIGLTEVKFPSGLTTIWNQAFYGCKKLTEVKFPSGLTTIWRGAFYGCQELKKVFISSSVREIGDNAFSDCSGLKEFKVDEENASYSQDGGVLFTKNRDTLVSYPGGRKGDYKIPSSVKGIKAGAFSGCQGLTAVTIPGSVKTIEGGTFFGCTGLTKLTIPKGVTEIGPNAFNRCKELKGVVIPSSVKTIENYAFCCCEGLTEVTIPGGVTTIGQLAFVACSNLNKVYWFADANCNVADDAFAEIDSPATLYVRKGKKEKIKDKPWCKNIFTIEEGYVVTFKDEDGHTLGKQLVEPNGTATAPIVPTREGYIVEWQFDGAKYDFGAKVTKDITLAAVWKKKEESTPSTPKDPKDPKTAVESVQLAAVRAVRNPVGEALELEGMERAARVEVYSVVGARVCAEALRGEPRVVIDARGWASGVYVVKVEASDGAKTLRVVK